MILLALDTALGATSIALCSGDTHGPLEILAERSEPMARGHAEALFGLIEAVCGQAGHALQTIEGICVSTGPGTFTGTRVGLAAARGLALGGRIPCSGVSTLEALAAMAPADTPRLTGIASRGNHVILQGFTAQSDPLGEPQLMALADVPEHIPARLKEAERFFVAGPAAEALCDVLHRAGIYADPVAETALPRPSVIADIGRARLGAGQAPKPHYVRPPDAKPAAPPPWMKAGAS